MAHAHLMSMPLVKDLTLCFVCSRPFNEPRVLPCQHSFCSDCLRKHIEQQQQRSPRIRMNTLRCPRCFQAATIPVRGPGSFPTDERAEKIKELIAQLGVDSLAFKMQETLKENLPHLRVHGSAGRQSRPSSWAFNENFNAVDDYKKHMTDTGRPYNRIPSKLCQEDKSADQKNTSETKTTTQTAVPTQEAATSIDESMLSDIQNNKPANQWKPWHLKRPVLQECAIQTELSGRDLICNHNDGMSSNVSRPSGGAHQANCFAATNNVPTHLASGAERADCKSAAGEDYCNNNTARAAHSSQAKQQTGLNIDLNSNYTIDKSNADKAQQPQAEKLSNKNKLFYDASYTSGKEQFSVSGDNIKRGHDSCNVAQSSQDQVKPEIDNNSDYSKMSHIKLQQQQTAFHGIKFTSPFSTNGGGEAQYTSVVNGVGKQETENVVEEMDQEEEVTVEFLPVYTDTPKILWEYEKQEYDMPTSVAFSESGERIAVTDFGNNHFLIFNSKGELEVTVDDVKPYSVAVDNEDHFVIADRRSRTLRVFHSDGSPFYEWEKDAFQWVSGLSVTSLGQIVVLDREFCRVGLYSPEGDKILEFGSHGDSDSHLFMADFLTVDAHDRILICDSGHHCVKIFDTRGSFLGRFGERGSQPGQLLWPKGVALDEANNVIVCDQKNNRISLFSPDGQFIQHIMDDYHSPFNTAFNSSKLAITSYSLNGNSAVKVYQV